MDIRTQHLIFVLELIGCSDSGSERARELRTMVLRLERIEPELERQRIEEMQARLAVTVERHD